jgi:hypothetical protein
MLRLLITYNLISSHMMPWTLKESSLVSGAVFLMMMCLFNGVTMIALAKCCEWTRSFKRRPPLRSLDASSTVIVIGRFAE